MDSPILHRRNAERLIFDDPDPVPRPSVAWYHPMTDSPPSTSQRKGLVLSREQEGVLFRQYNYARLRVCRVRVRMGKQPTDSVLDTLLRWYDLALDRRDQIVETNLALVLAMARRVRGPESDFSDIIAEGNVALMRCVDKFDCERGFKFSTYACRAILKSFYRYGSKQAKYRQRAPYEFDPDRAHPIVETPQDEASEGVEQVRRIMRENEADLSPMEQEILSCRFGINAGPDPKRMTLEQVGRRIGMTKERVRQLQNKAIEKLREAMGSHGEGDLSLN